MEATSSYGSAPISGGRTPRRARLIKQVNEQRNPRTKATVNQLTDRYLEVLDVDVTTRNGYEAVHRALLAR